MTPLISELGRTRMEVNAKVKAGFGAKDFALNVVITIPVPDTTAKADIHTSIGAVCIPLLVPLRCRLSCSRRTSSMLLVSYRLVSLSCMPLVCH